MQHLHEQAYAENVKNDVQQYNRAIDQRKQHYKSAMNQYAEDLRTQIEKDREKKLKEYEMNDREK